MRRLQLSLVAMILAAAASAPAFAQDRPWFNPAWEPGVQGAVTASADSIRTNVRFNNVLHANFAESDELIRQRIAMFAMYKLNKASKPAPNDGLAGYIGTVSACDKVHNFFSANSDEFADKTAARAGYASIIDEAWQWSGSQPAKARITMRATLGTYSADTQTFKYTLDGSGGFGGTDAWLALDAAFKKVTNPNLGKSALKLTKRSGVFTASGSSATSATGSNVMLQISTGALSCGVAPKNPLVTLDRSMIAGGVGSGLYVDIQPIALPPLQMAPEDARAYAQKIPERTVLISMDIEYRPGFFQGGSIRGQAYELNATYRWADASNVGIYAMDGKQLQ